MSYWITQRLFGVASLTIVLVASWMPRSWAFDGPLGCVIQSALGFPCPGCGLTRSVYSFFHGEFSQSLAFNPMGPLLSVLFILWSFELVLYSRSWWRSFMTWSQITAAVLLFGVWALEMGLAAWV